MSALQYDPDINLLVWVASLLVQRMLWDKLSPLYEKTDSGLVWNEQHN